VASEWFQSNRNGAPDAIRCRYSGPGFFKHLTDKHFFVRLFGLKNKVVIFDEVHAYDCYMQELFTCLLRWLRSMGTAVIVLSATLPEAFRKQIIAAYCGKETVIPDNLNYPC